MRRGLALWLLVGACRFHFDEQGDGDGGGSGGPSARWVTTFTDATDASRINGVAEDAGGDIWIAGDSLAFGPNYRNGWIAHVNGASGAVDKSGVRNFGGGEEAFQGIGLASDHLVVVGESYGPNAEQPAVGTLDLAGEWVTSYTLGGGLIHPNEHEVLYGLAPTPDGGWLASGKTNIGSGGCSSCDGNDGLVVKFAGDGSLVWTRVFGEAVGDESYDHIMTFADGESVAYGAGFEYDYSGGANTDIDIAPALITALASDGAPRWSLRPRVGVELRGAILDGGAIDADGKLLFSGSVKYRLLPFIMQMTRAGTVEWIREIHSSTNPNGGAVSSVLVADDGGLFVSGYEYDSNQQTTRTGYVARIDKARTGVVWARSFPLADVLGTGYTAVSLTRARNGDLLVRASGIDGTFGSVGLVRLDDNGNGPACFTMTAITMALTDRADSSFAVSLTETTVTGALDVDVPAGQDLPTSPAPIATCR